MLAPLRYDGQTVGALAVHDRVGEVRGFSTSDLHLLQTIASHASVALHNEMLIGRLRHEALHDTLTGLPNRAQLTAEMITALAEARPLKQQVAVMILDLNGFKTVNDTLGHHVGDDLLRQVSSRFSEVCPSEVTVARLGGDEFAVLAPSTTVERAEEIAGRLLNALTPTFVVGQERLHLSGSIGIALAPDHGRTVSDLLKRADIAMYAAKNGASPSVLYRADIDMNDASLLSLMGELREAIAAGDVDIEVEPVVDLRTDEIASAEALVRWHHPVRGTLRPGLFLPLGRAQRADRTAHDPGARPSRGRLRPLARGRPRHPHLGEPVGAVVARHRASCGRGGRAVAVQPAQQVAHPGDHREHRAQRRRPGTGAARRPAQPRRTPLARRLRYRLLLSHAPSPSCPSSS